MSDTQGQGQTESGTASGSSSTTPAPIAVPEGLAAAVGQPAAPTPPAQQEAQGQQQEQQYQLSEHANALLKDLPEEQRAQFEPILQKWDAGVTRRYQELQSQLDPFKPFLEQGMDQDFLSQSMQLREFFEQDPLALAQVILRNHPQAQGFQGGPGANQQQAPGSEEFGELHPDVVQFIQAQQQETGQMRQLVEAMAQQMVSQNQSVATQQEDSQLDQYMTLLKTEMGDFDEDFVLAKMDGGMDGAEAVKQYQSTIQSAIDQRLGGQQGAGQTLFGETGQATPGGSAPPAVLSGGSYAPHTRSITEASPQETSKFVAEILRKANRG